MFETGADPAAIVEQKGLKQISDATALERVAAEIIAANPDQVAKLRDNPKVFGWFVGQVMKATQGQANPQLVNEVLRKKLEVISRRRGLDIGSLPGMKFLPCVNRRPIESRFVTSRLGVKSQTVVPKEVREALGVGPGDQIGYSIQNGRVILTAIERPWPRTILRLLRRMGVRSRHRGLCLALNAGT